MNRRLALVLAVPAVAATLAFAAPAAGPPWISIEYPPSPYDRTTRDAYLLVHTFHHGTPQEYPLSGSAEGIVRGERKSVELAFEGTSRPGVFALKRQWPADGAWTLVIGIAPETRGGVTAVVDIGADGRVASARVPTVRRDGWEVGAPYRAIMADVDASLRARATALARSR
jgi:hypothetical protein